MSLHADILDTVAARLNRAISDFEGHIAVDKMPDGRFKARWNRNANWTYGWQDVGVYQTEKQAHDAAKRFHEQKDHPIRNVAQLLEILADRLAESAPKIDLRPEILKEWAKMEPLFKQLREPERPAIPYKALNLKPNGGLQNILNVYDQATPEERDYWGRWYHDASGTVQQMADRHNLPLTTVAGVVAVLSPGNKWWMNVRVADKLIFFWENGALKIMGPLSAYPLNVKKALAILEKGDPSGLINSPKVSVFYNSLVDPAGIEDDIVLDGHALNIWRGDKVNLKQAINPNTKLREQIVNDYKEAAKQLGITVQAVQATTWYVWKSVEGGETEKQAAEFDLTAEHLEARLMLKDFKTEFAPAVSKAYEARPMLQASAVPAWDAAIAFVEKQFKQVETRLKIEFVDYDPYKSFKDMNEKVAREGVLKIWNGASDTHPVWTAEQNWKFRAVHDYQSHLAGGHKFTLKGELASYNRHLKTFPHAAWPCLFTEIVGQTCYYNVHKTNTPDQKVAILYGFDYQDIGSVDEIAYKKNFEELP